MHIVKPHKCTQNMRNHNFLPSECMHRTLDCLCVIVLRDSMVTTDVQTNAPFGAF